MAHCPYGYTLISGLCYSNCPANTIVLESNIDFCVGTQVCQTGTLADASGAACVKVPPVGVKAIVGDSCEAGYTEWTQGQCYINCNAFFLENATECRRKLYPRRVQDPWCTNWLYTVQNNNCVFNWTAFLLFIFGLLLAFFLIYIIFRQSLGAGSNVSMNFKTGDSSIQ